MSKMLQVRNVPDEIHSELKRRAAQAGMSLSEFALRELEKVTQRREINDIRAEVERDGVELTWEQILRARDDARGEPW